LKQTEITKYKISLANSEHTREEFVSAWERYEVMLHDDPKLLPNETRYCLEVGISETHILEYVAKIPEVGEILQHIFDLQKAYCLENGITQKVNPIFSMFLLKAKHNFHDSPQSLTQNNSFNISKDVLADALAIMSKKKK
jgi:hypothetical protein